MSANERIFSFMKKAYYPPIEIRLLQKAAVAPIPMAREAWCKWRDLNRLDVTSWQERKILARMHNRIPLLDPDYDHFQRVIGLTKSEWAGSAFILKESMVAVDLLLENGFEIMFFKGVALDKRYDAKGVRLSGDLDILVPENDFVRALILLRKNNWVTVAVTDWLERYEPPREIHGLNYTNARGGNIDIHRRPSHSIPDSKYLERLWKQSEIGNFMGRRVRFCSQADYLALLVDHGIGNSFGEHISSIWPVDFHQSVSKNSNQLLAEFTLSIKQLKIPLQCNFALSYCKDILHSDHTTAFVRNFQPLNMSAADIIRSVLHSPTAFTRGTLLWLLAGSIRRTSRNVRRFVAITRDCFPIRWIKSHYHVTLKIISR